MEKDFEHFFQANERRIYFQIHRLGIKGEWFAEFYAEGIFAMWKAYEAYDGEKAEIGTYVNYQIRYRLIDLLRKKLREAEVAEEAVQEEIIKLDNGNRHRTSGMPIVNCQGIELKDQEFWEEVASRLTKNQWKWVQYFIIADLSVKEIMEIEGVTADTVKGWGQAVRRKLRKDEVLKEKLKELLKK